MVSLITRVFWFSDINVAAASSLNDGADVDQTVCILPEPLCEELLACDYLSDPDTEELEVFVHPQCLLLKWWLHLLVHRVYMGVPEEE